LAVVLYPGRDLLNGWMESVVPKGRSSVAVAGPATGPI